MDSRVTILGGGCFHTPAKGQRVQVFYKMDKLFKNLVLFPNGMDQVDDGKKKEAPADAAWPGKPYAHVVGYCYDPHHAFVFYDADWNVVASVDICLRCQRYQTRSLAVAKRLDFSKLRKFCQDAGLPVLPKNSAYTKLFERENIQ